MDSELVEAVAKRMFARRMEAEGADHSQWAWRYQTQRDALRADAQAIIPIVLERAAKAAESVQYKPNQRMGKAITGRSAQAIRSLIKDDE